MALTLAGLTVVPHPLDVIDRHARLASMHSLILNLDADNECEHGRLPTDSSPDCGCFGPVTA